MSAPLLVAGVDSSTQTCKLLVVDAASGRIVRRASAPHPDGTAVAPGRWWDALSAATSGMLDGVAALSVAAQQHTAIFLDAHGESIRDAILWNDVRAADAGMALRAHWGRERWTTEIGLVPTAAHPVAKLRWLRDNEPGNAARLARVLLPHDWLTWNLLARPAEATTDRSDASSTGYWSVPGSGYSSSAAELAFGRPIASPRVLGPRERAGTTRAGLVLGAGCGDNPAAALGLSAGPDEIILSVGTSMTATAVCASPLHDPDGVVDDMADATGRFLPIVTSLNGARVLVAVARLLSLDLDTFDELASLAAGDAEGLCLLPYLDGERHPHFPSSTGALLGVTRSNLRPENLARAAVLGVAAAAADSIAHLRRAGVTADRVTMIGGGSRSRSLRQAVATLTGRVVVHPRSEEYAAYGAARQAHWALTGRLPDWQRDDGSVTAPDPDASWRAEVLERHADHGARLFGG